MQVLNYYHAVKYYFQTMKYYFRDVIIYFQAVRIIRKHASPHSPLQRHAAPFRNYLHLGGHFQIALHVLRKVARAHR